VVVNLSVVEEVVSAAIVVAGVVGVAHVVVIAVIVVVAGAELVAAELVAVVPTVDARVKSDTGSVGVVALCDVTVS
jgi:UPF0716 family protein affecting phage T7 exclusion